ncbi:MAG: CoA-binding protein, partial [bacterium]
KVLWLQEKIINHDAQRICKDAGMEVIMDRCILQEHRKAGLSG